MPGMVRPVSDERDALLAYLDHQRHLVRVAVHGLDDAAARTRPTASALSPGGIVKHLAAVEHNWMDVVEQRDNRGNVETYMAGFSLSDGETLADALAMYDAAAQRTARVIAGIDDLSRAVPVPQDRPWFPKDVDAWSVRWVLLHLIEETARHLGHADIIRESLDGATAIPLLAAAESWPETPWVKPWQPAGAA